MANSMTGFASATGGDDIFVWSWDLRSVNARGLDLRLRIPDWLSGLEQAVRAQAGKRLARGSVTVSLRVMREESGGDLSVNETVLTHLLAAVARITERAATVDVLLTPPTAIDLLGFRGVTGDDQPWAEGGEAALAARLIADFAQPLEALMAMRAQEGAALVAILTRQLDDLAALLGQAAEAGAARQEQARTTLQSNVALLMSSADGLDPARLAQELALLAVKSDVTEELDRLGAHVDAARLLLGIDGPIGRKLDFLMQEFNREANTLCSKAGSTLLTGIGLDLKTLIDQMREQVQNLE